MKPDNAEKTWFERNPRKTILFVFLAFFGILEILMRILVAAELLPLRYYPTGREPQFWGYVDQVVGMWKHPNAQFVHLSNCFRVENKSNSIGARDIERNPSSGGKPRVFVLGDSFVEGWGIATNKRFTNVLEQITGVEHLNFGSSVYFGTIQEWLLYQKWGPEYEHTEVMLFIFPETDFDDNNPESFAGDAYRPFLKKENNETVVYYPVEYEQRDTGKRSIGELIRNNIYMNSYLINNLVIFITNIINPEINIPVSRYYSYTEDELDTMLYSINRIRELAGDRPLRIFLIPAEYDVETARQNNLISPLAKALQNYAAEHDNTFVTDLLPAFVHDMDRNQRAFRDYTLGCDSHWNELGHQLAADIVLESM